jgi:hypothetical protein
MRYINAAQAATLCHSGEGRDPGVSVSISIAPGADAPVSPVAPPAMIFIRPSRQAQAAQTRHRQILLVCDTFSLMTSVVYLIVAQWHRQKPTYCTRRRARACVLRLLILIYYFNYLKKCLCHCSQLTLLRFSVCSCRMFLSVPSVPNSL